MSDKEYKLQQWSSRSLYYSFPGGGYHDEISSVLRRVENDLNRLYDENLFLKAKESERDEELLGLHHRVRELNEENELLKHQLTQQEREYATDLHRLVEGSWND